MSHLLAIAVGPVQEFIAAARRTRDLWFGSYLLSEISRAVAKAVEIKVDGKTNLIFPASVDAENVANVILAELPAGDPKEVAKQAKEAAKDCWKQFAEEARLAAPGAIRPKLPHEEKSIWDEQVDDVIEFYAAWVPHTDPKDYREDRKKLMRLLAGRKNCRDFLPAKGRAGVPKSSLDGQRETVLRDGDRTEWPKKLRLSNGEQLDVVGITKRLGKQKGESDPRYPSVARVAAETWLSGMEKQNALDRLKDACQKLVPKGLNTVREEKYSYFPYEGTVIYKDRLTDLQKELRLLEDDFAELKAALDELGGKPSPYLAVLVADGDKMGAAISQLPDAEANRAFSKTLAGFAAEARQIVTDHHGVLVYAGGDDVLAFLPVDKCLSCARKLHDDFGDRLAKYGKPTLSVGIAIGHFMENLEDLLEYGRDAEKAAKKVDGKDALAVHLYKRGGAPIKIASRWQTKPDQRLTLYGELMQHEALPSKLPYDLMKLIEIYQADGWPEGERRRAMQQDALRIIADKQPRAGRRYMPIIRRIVGEFQAVVQLEQFCDELLIARQLAAAFKQSRRMPSELPQASAEVEAVA